LGIGHERLTFIQHVGFGGAGLARRVSERTQSDPGRPSVQPGQTVQGASLSTPLRATDNSQSAGLEIKSEPTALHGPCDERVITPARM
jgi:hypothetical protein